MFDWGDERRFRFRGVKKRRPKYFPQLLGGFRCNDEQKESSPLSLVMGPRLDMLNQPLMTHMGQRKWLPVTGRGCDRSQLRGRGAATPEPAL